MGQNPGTLVGSLEHSWWLWIFIAPVALEGISAHEEVHAISQIAYDL